MIIARDPDVEEPCMFKICMHFYEFLFFVLCLVGINGYGIETGFVIYGSGHEWGGRYQNERN